jgi:hypothetical protein
MNTTPIAVKVAPFRRSGPPKVSGSGPRPSTKSPVNSCDDVRLSGAAKPTEEKDPSRGLKAALTGLALISAFAGPALVHAPPGVAPLAEQSVEKVSHELLTIPSLRVTPSDLMIESKERPTFNFDSLTDLKTVQTDTTKTKVGVQINSVNDFMPAAWTPWLGGPQHKVPDGSAFDDDGWTAEVQLLTNFQKGDTETVVGGRIMMLTQPGSRPPYGEDYQGLRTDVGEFVIQRNLRTKLSDDLTLDYGIGGGFQAVGKVGGEPLQRWWHESGPVGGRTGDALQGNYTTDSFRVMPMLTGGAKLSYAVHPHLDLRVGGQASVPLGNGLGVAGLRAGIGSRYGPFNLEVGAKLDAAWTDAPELAFHDVSGVRDGLYGRIEYEPGKWGGIYTQLETGGFRNEPILTFGVRIGFGTGARLNPFQ